MSSLDKTVNHAGNLALLASSLTQTNQELKSHGVKSRVRKLIMYMKKRTHGTLGKRLEVGKYSVTYSSPSPVAFTVDVLGLCKRKDVQEESEESGEDEWKNPHTFFHQSDGLDDHELRIMRSTSVWTKSTVREKFHNLKKGMVLKCAYNGISVPIRTLEELDILLHLRDFKTLRFSVDYDNALLGGAPPRKKPKGKKSRRGKTRGKNTEKEDGYVVASQLGLRNPSMMYTNLPPVKELWTVDQVLEASGAGEVSTFFSLFDPNQAINGTVVYQRAADLSKIYDEYRVNTVIVLLENFVQSTTLATFRFAVDYDSIPSGLYTYDSLADNSTMREYSGTNQASYMVRPPRMTQGTKNGTQVTIYKGGWMDFATPPDEGFIIFAGKNFVPSQKYSVTIRVMVQCRRRRTINVARDEILEKEHEKLLKRKSK